MYFYEYLFVRTSIFWLLFAGTLGFLFYLEPALLGPWRSVHVHAGVVGFFLNLVFGVAYWMMPRPGQIKQPGLEATTFWTLNLGLSLRVVVEPFPEVFGPAYRDLLALAAFLQLVAMFIFAFAMHRRVVTNEMLWRLRKEREKRQRE